MYITGCFIWCNGGSPAGVRTFPRVRRLERRETPPVSSLARARLRSLFDITCFITCLGHNLFVRHENLDREFIDSKLFDITTYRGTSRIRNCPPLLGPP